MREEHVSLKEAKAIVEDARPSIANDVGFSLQLKEVD
jgi:ribosomal protein L7/L12